GASRRDLLPCGGRGSADRRSHCAHERGGCESSAGLAPGGGVMRRKPLTATGAERLRAELKRLKSEDRPRIIQAIAEARSHGDLSENAEYHAAREQQSFIEGRIKDIEAHLSNSEII